MGLYSLGKRATVGDGKSSCSHRGHFADREGPFFAVLLVVVPLNSSSLATTRLRDVAGQQDRSACCLEARGGLQSPPADESPSAIEARLQQRSGNRQISKMASPFSCVTCKGRWKMTRTRSTCTTAKKWARPGLRLKSSIRLALVEHRLLSTAAAAPAPSKSRQLCRRTCKRHWIAYSTSRPSGRQRWACTSTFGRQAKRIGACLVGLVRRETPPRPPHSRLMTLASSTTPSQRSPIPPARCLRSTLRPAGHSRRSSGDGRQKRHLRDGSSTGVAGQVAQDGQQKRSGRRAWWSTSA